MTASPGRRPARGGRRRGPARPPGLEPGEAPEIGRAFVAVRPPDAVLDALEAALVPARKVMVGPRWSAREQWHLTVQFLGAVAALAPVAAALDAAVGDRPPIRFRLGGAGAFPRTRRARVVWVGATEGGSALSDLAAAVGRALAPLGHEPEESPFRPHLTVARLREPADVAPVLGALPAGPVGDAFWVREVVLCESRLSATGPRYRDVHRVALTGPAGDGPAREEPPGEGAAGDRPQGP